MARGSIQKATHGYRLRVEIAPDPVTGKRRWHSEMAPTKRRAEERVRELLMTSHEGHYRANSRQLFGEYLTSTWLPYYRTRVRPSTLLAAETRLHKHILPRLGHLRLCDLRAIDIEAAYASLHAAGLQPTTIRAIHQTMSASLNRAVAWELLRRNPASGCMPRTGEVRPRTLWTDTQIAHFLENNTGSTLYAIVTLIATTGLRRGEALALTWADLNEAERTLRVERSLTRTRDDHGRWHWTVGAPKSASSYRTIAIRDIMLPVLLDYRKEQLRRLVLYDRIPEPVWMFDRGDGEWVSPDTLRHWWDTAVRESGLPKARMHDLRHGVATTMLRAGIPLKVVSEYLGHANIAITADVYQHVTLDMKQQAAETLGGFLTPPSAPVPTPDAHPACVLPPNQK